MSEQYDRAAAEAAVAEINLMVTAFIAESLKDPDMAGQSAEFKRGYEKGVREMFVANMFRGGSLAAVRGIQKDAARSSN